MFKYLMLLLSVCLCAGCATDRTFGLDPSIEVTQLESLPEPSEATEYTIGPLEEIDILVVGADDLSGTFLTDARGNISYPYIGQVNTAGQSPDRAAALIAQGLRGGVVLDPQVRVIPKNIAQPTISLGGEVERPGAYPATGAPTLLRLINQAEGLAEYASKDDVLIFREVNGQRYVGLYDIGAIARGNYEDPRLFANDIVLVGDAPGRRRFDKFLRLGPFLTSAVVLLDRVGR